MMPSPSHSPPTHDDSEENDEHDDEDDDDEDDVEGSTPFALSDRNTIKKNGSKETVSGNPFT